MRTNRYRPLTEEICRLAVIECFKHKWVRTDTLLFIEKTVGIPRDEMELASTADYRTYLIGEAIDGVGLFLYEVAGELIRGNAPDEFMEPVTVQRRKDGATGKERDIATLCVTHQLLEHLVKLMLEPLLMARITQTQHASIPGRGQVQMKKQVQRQIRSGRLGIEAHGKTDFVQAYRSTKYSLCIELVEMESPRAHDAITLLNYLGSIAPGGHLIIGGYLDAWLFNFVASYAVRKMNESGRTRRGKFIKDVERVDAYMDDFVILAKTVSGIERAVRNTGRWTKEVLGLEMVLKVEPQKIVAPIDAAGFQIAERFVTIRKTIWRRIRRVLIRAYQMLQKTGTIRIETARKIVSYNGYFKQTDSLKVREDYHVAQLMKVARRVVRFHAYLQRKRRKERNNALQSAVERRTGKGYAGAVPGQNYCPSH